jgi:hypothetical protein
LLFVVTAIPGAASSRSSNPGCVDVWGEARYRNYGYDHIVHINNRCAALVTCDVSTDVNPGIQRVTIPPKQEIEVLTFRGSPSRDFVANAECRLTL